MPIGAPLRMALAAAYKLPVISEQLADSYPHRDGHDILLCDADQAHETSLRTLANRLPPGVDPGGAAVRPGDAERDVEGAVGRGRDDRLAHPVAMLGRDR